MMPVECCRLAERVLERLGRLRRRLAVAESCTGGLISACLTEIPGASAWFEAGYVTYSNQVKRRLFHLSGRTLNRFGAVSVQTAQVMAEGARQRAAVDWGLSVTGIAGPSGATQKKPIGLVHICLVKSDHFQNWCFIFSGTRSDIRYASTYKALQVLLRG